jgi:hypothetical protein
LGAGIDVPDLEELVFGTYGDFEIVAGVFGGAVNLITISLKNLFRLFLSILMNQSLTCLINQQMTKGFNITTIWNQRLYRFQILIFMCPNHLFFGKVKNLHNI